VTVFGQFTREIGADAAGGAGNEGEGARGVFHDNGSELIKPMGGDWNSRIRHVCCFYIYSEQRAIQLRQVLVGVRPRKIYARGMSICRGLVRRLDWRDSSAGYSARGSP